jgi:hypothetical protein
MKNEDAGTYRFPWSGKLKLLEIEECNNPRTPEYIAYESKGEPGLAVARKGTGN